MSVDSFIYGYIVNEESYEANEYLIKEGSKGDWVYVILEGQVKVKKRTSKGMVTIDTLKEGDIFGEMILWQLGKSSRSASVIADGHVKVGLLSTERLLQDYESVSPRLKTLLKSLIMRLADITNSVAILAVESNR
jgi:CRP-like cAMP-binding protein